MPNIPVADLQYSAEELAAEIARNPKLLAKKFRAAFDLIGNTYSVADCVTFAELLGNEIAKRVHNPRRRTIH